VTVLDFLTVAEVNAIYNSSTKIIYGAFVMSHKCTRKNLGKFVLAAIFSLLSIQSSYGISLENQPLQIKSFKSKATMVSHTFKGGFDISEIENTSLRAELHLKISPEERNELLTTATCLGLNAKFYVIARGQDKIYDKSFFGPACLGHDPKYVNGGKQAVIVQRGIFQGKQQLTRRVIIKFLGLNKQLNTYPVKITVENFFKQFYEWRDPKEVRDRLGDEIVANIVRVDTPELSFVGLATWNATLRAETKNYEFRSDSPDTYLPTEIGRARSPVGDKIEYSRAIVVGIPVLK
jgi:hypothetical protein